jgi:hypothetical protein
MNLQKSKIHQVDEWFDLVFCLHSRHGYLLIEIRYTKIKKRLAQTTKPKIKIRRRRC